MSLTSYLYTIDYLFEPVFTYEAKTKGRVATVQLFVISVSPLVSVWNEDGFYKTFRRERSLGVHPQKSVSLFIVKCGSEASV